MSEDAVPEIQGEVVATGSAVNSQLGKLGQAIETAMAKAIEACYAEGKTEVEYILAAKMKAMEEVKASFGVA